MKEMEKVLLVFDESEELDFIESNLKENEFHVYRSSDLNEALIIAKNSIPDLIVVNTLNSEAEIKSFARKIKSEIQNKPTLFSLIELENYLHTENKEFFIVKPVRPKLLLSLIRSVMKNEAINWLPSL